MKTANANPDNPIEKVLEVAEKKTETEDHELVRWSLMKFITFHPEARKSKLRIPPLIKRAGPPKTKKSPVQPPTTGENIELK